jgi:heme-degrading monooxygenase HmoA
MIVRTWRARAALDREHLYPQYLSDVVLPKLRVIPGYLGAYLLRRADRREVEFVLQTLWASFEAIQRFAGPAPERAVIEPNAEAMLIDFDTTVTHHEVLVSPSELSPPLRNDRG